MSEDTLTIPQKPELGLSEDYEFLRSEGLRFISELSGKVWTDYNTHDPGITMLELLCYAITDLAYRTSFPMEDLLAEEDGEETGTHFFKAEDILPVNPVTELDLRKLIIDVEEVKNAWISTARDYEQPVYIDRTNCKLTLDPTDGNRILPITGLYNVLLEFEDAPDGKEENELSYREKELRKERADRILSNVRKTLMAHRGLCEDVLSINTVSHQDIAICADIEVDQNVNVAELQARIYKFAIDYFSPSLQFYTLSEMLEKKLTVDEIFEGPLLEHGFIDNEELEEASLRSEIYVSDIINAIMDMEGVIAVREIKLIPYNGDTPGSEYEWKLTLGEAMAGRLSKTKSKIMFYKNDLPYMAHPDEVNAELRTMQQTEVRVRLKNYDNELETPEGRYRNLTDYVPVQNEFPLVYGIGADGLPANASEKRVSQAKQLKAYLGFFEQLLTNYLAQLANIKKLFSFEASVTENDDETFSRSGKTYFVQQLKEAGLFNDSDILYQIFMSTDEEERAELRNKLVDNFCEEYLASAEGIAALAAIDASSDSTEKDALSTALIENIGSYYEDKMQALAETDDKFADRRSRMLDHLLARFCEDMSEYSLMLYAEYGKEAGKLRYIADKETLLSEYPEVSRDRNRAYNYKPENPFMPDTHVNDDGIWHTHNVSGLKHRIIRLLGMDRHARPTITDRELELFEDNTGPDSLWSLRIADFRSPGDYLITTAQFEDRDYTEQLLYRMMLAGGDSANYVVSETAPYTYELMSDATLTESLGVSEEFVGPGAEDRRDEALADTISFFRGESKGYIRRTLAPVNITIEERFDSDLGHKVFKAVVADPLIAGEVLLETEEDEDRSCVEGWLHYMLHNGDDAANYRTQGSDPYYFELMDGCEAGASVVARSRDFTGDNGESNRDALMELTLRFFRYACDIENFHLVEHILLRPRTPLDSLLPACVQCPLPETVTDPAIKDPEYTVVIHELAPDEIAEEMSEEEEETDAEMDVSPGQWQFQIVKHDESEILSSEGYSSINACLHGLHATRQYGAFDIAYETDKDGKAILDYKKGIRIYSDSFSSSTSELLVKGKKTYASEDEMREEMKALQEFFKFNGDILPSDEEEAAAPFICNGDEDPYSFRISFVLPGWPTRFRSLNFRRYVEKVIRSETPAHIYARICWVDFEQMKDFESAYEQWVQTLAVNSIPNPNVTSEFIDELFNLHNIYPTAVLHDCETVSASDSRVVLGQTTLGSL